MKLRLAAVLALAMGTLLHADDGLPAMPPDIAAIIAKMKAGGMPSADDLAKLKAWQQGIANRVPVPTAGKPAPDSIPCRIHVTLEARSDTSNFHWTLGLNGDVDASLMATLGGDGDYYLNQLDPSKPASTFIFTPKPNASLRGGLSYRGWGNGSSEAVEATLSKTRFGSMWTTTGHDDLFATGGGFDANEDGTLTERTSVADTNQVHDPELRYLNGIAVPFVMENRETLTTGKPTPKPAMKLSYKALADAIKSGQTRTITGTESFSFADGVAQIVGTSTISITLRPKPLELDVEPDNQATFQKWLPMPDKTDVGRADLFGDPKPLVVHVALRDGKHGPADTKGVLAISLDSASHLPGVAMNFPPRAEAKDKPDLFFPPQQPPGIQVIDETHVKTTGPVLEARVKIAARDTGAFGRVVATCEALGITTSIDPRTGANGLFVPMDDNHDHIADDWENAIANPQATADDEDTPAMSSRGDGYTLFDEYRGFIVDDDGSGEKHVRFSPHDRDLIVLPRGPDAKLYRIGAQGYAKATGVKLHFVRDVGRTAPWPGGQQPRWANFNETPDSVHASAVIIEDIDATKPDGDVGFTHVVGDQYARHAPDTVDYIDISRVANTNQVDGYFAILQNPKQDVLDTMRRLHLIRMDVLKAIPNNRKHLTDENIEFATMHELGHATGGLHHSLQEARRAPNTFAAMTIESHGDVYCPMRYWQYGPIEEWISFMAGTWIPLDAPYAGGKWTFCTAPDADGPNLRLRP